VSAGEVVAGETEAAGVESAPDGLGAGLSSTAIGSARLARILPATQPEKTEPWSDVIGRAAGQPACHR
jgi:hypothetical protein